MKEIASVTPSEPAKEPVNEAKLSTENKETEPVANDAKDGKDTESQQSEVKPTGTNSETVVEAKTETSLETKSTSEKSKEQPEPESDANNDKNVKPEEHKAEPSLQSTPAAKPTKRKAKVIKFTIFFTDYSFKW